MDFAGQILGATYGRSHVFFAGQAGFIFKSKKGTTLAVDLYLTDCVERFDGEVAFKRLTPKILSPEDLIFDYIVCTHPHLDHFDIGAMPILMSNPHTKLIASTDCSKLVHQLQMPERNITYVSVGDHYVADDIELDIVFCDHGTQAPDAFGLVITMDDTKFYIAGDTCLRLDKVEEIAAYGPFDVVIGPINGAFGNLNEAEFATLVHTLSPKLAIPCHYGTFPAHGGSPKLFIEEMQKQCPDKRFWLMAQGEHIEVRDFV